MRRDQRKPINFIKEGGVSEMNKIILIKPLPPFEDFRDWEGVKDEGDFASFKVDKKTGELIGNKMVDTEDISTITINRNEYEAVRKTHEQFKSLIKSKLHESVKRAAIKRQKFAFLLNGNCLKTCSYKI